MSRFIQEVLMRWITPGRVRRFTIAFVEVFATLPAGQLPYYQAEQHGMGAACRTAVEAPSIRDHTDSSTTVASPASTVRLQ